MMGGEVGPDRAFPLVRPVEVFPEVDALLCVTADEEEGGGGAAVAVATEEEEEEEECGVLEAGEGRMGRE